MYKLSKMKNKIIFWIPRILAILFILFLSLFALDVFEEYSGLVMLLAFLLHMIPSFLLIIMLVVAWKWEIVGGWILLAFGIGFTMFNHLYRDPISFLVVSIPIFAVGILFLLSHKYNKK